MLVPVGEVSPREYLFLHESSGSCSSRLCLIQNQFVGSDKFFEEQFQFNFSTPLSATQRLGTLNVLKMTLFLIVNLSIKFVVDSKCIHHAGTCEQHFL